MSVNVLSENGMKKKIAVNATLKSFLYKDDTISSTYNKSAGQPKF